MESIIVLSLAATPPKLSLLAVPTLVTLVAFVGGSSIACNPTNSDSAPANAEAPAPPATTPEHPEDAEDPFLAGVEAEIPPCDDLVIPGADSRSWFVGPPQEADGEPVAETMAIVGTPLFATVGCGDRPGSFAAPDLFPTEQRAGVTFALESIDDAGPSGRGYSGGHCAFSLWRSEPEGRILTLSQDVVPPFSQPTEVLRDGDAAWIALRPAASPTDYPTGGGRIVSVDLCSGALRWVSENWRSTGPMLRLGGRLISVAWSPTEGYLLAVTDADSGERLETAPLNGPLTGLGFGEGFLILESEAGTQVLPAPSPNLRPAKKLAG